MCGIVGYIGGGDAAGIALCALKRLEYRGYDSYGFCILDRNQNFTVFRRVGKIQETEDEFIDQDFRGNVAIGHSRWATTGEVSQGNAHPHTDCNREIFVVHNGIIENYKKIRTRLEEFGHTFTSETDTEVIAHLIEGYYTEDRPLVEAVTLALEHIRGTYGIAVVSTREPDKIIAARMSSPVIIGVGDGEMMVVSDPSAVISITRNIIILEDGEIAVIRKDGLTITKDRTALEKQVECIDWDIEAAERGDHDHFMLKEIFECPETVENAIMGRIDTDNGTFKLGGIEGRESDLAKADHLLLIGCGTAHYAAMLGKYLFEELAGIPTSVDIASEMRYRRPVLPKNTAAVFISQSGETADTLGAMHELKRRGILCVGITNVVGSSQARETDCGVYTRTGPEIAVASTKAFIGQVVTEVMMATHLGRQRNLSDGEGRQFISAIKTIPCQMERLIRENESHISSIARKYQDFRKYWFVGRRYQYPIALEGSLKLREISYIPSGASAGGELKHGTLAIIDNACAVVALCQRDSVYEKMITNIEEIRTRAGKIIAIATEGDKEIRELADDVIYVPKTIEPLAPLLTVIPTYLLAYYTALGLGNDIDKPKNLAKSVTVE